MDKKSVAIFAYNEAGSIRDTIASLDAAGLNADDEVYVLINGCTDNTLEIVQEIAKADQRIHPVEITLGDKANAWDVYVDGLAPEDAELHIFLDGDVIPSENAFTEMLNVARDNPEALAVSSLPKGGRKSPSWRKRIVKFSGMPGNMYGLKRETFARMKTLPVRIPIGLVGDDPLLRFLLLRNLDPTTQENLKYIKPVETAFFHYESFPLTNFSGLNAIWKRQLRYARRDLEHALLTKKLSTNGLKTMPRNADELWSDFPKAVFMQHTIQPRFILFPIIIVKAWLTSTLKTKGKAWDE